MLHRLRTQIRPEGPRRGRSTEYFIPSSRLRQGGTASTLPSPLVK
ncbi:MAG: hypothetical protein AVDCRST_MAG25-660 [uncultured Rubrobacteraceae bacterium]|uniref:Uncharacterized protein n=1 Tax=uncultured Rubrobacteraceae bacterium TaxID=349277 RepID=A0A6J4R7H8_9ACTN|nr:MAG: hypothetical protein AVDCRST_MAG25-660 [uncultured Rubrobacteraceae bacterium]